MILILLGKYNNIFMYIMFAFFSAPQYTYISFNMGGSFSTSWMWKMSPGKLPCPRTWNNIIGMLDVENEPPVLNEPF